MLFISFTIMVSSVNKVIVKRVVHACIGSAYYVQTRREPRALVGFNIAKASISNNFSRALFRARAS